MEKRVSIKVTENGNVSHNFNLENLSYKAALEELNTYKIISEVSERKPTKIHTTEESLIISYASGEIVSFEIVPYYRLDYFGDIVVLPEIGDKVLIDGYEFVVSEVNEHRSPLIIASITLKGNSGVKETGYYNFLKLKKA